MKLKECCTFIDYRGKTPEKSEEGYRLLTAKNVKPTGYSDEPREYIPEASYESVMVRGIPKEGDILFTTEAPLGNVCRIPYFSQPFAVGQRLIVIQPDCDLLDYQYMVYKLRSSKVQEEIFKRSSGSTVRGIRSKELIEIDIDFPDLEEQQLISRELVLLEHIIEQRAEELKALDELIKARFVEMFGTPNGNEKGFQMMTVDDVIEFTGGAQPDKKFFEYEPTKDNIRLIQIRDYKSDNYVTYIPKDKARRFCNAEDIMIGRYGPPIFQILKGIEGSYNVALMKATPKMGNREFIRYFLKQDCLFNYLDGLSQRTAGQSGIEMPALKAYPFPYPPIELQNEFERFVKQVDKSKVAVQAALDKAQLLFNSLMQEYFG